MRRLALVVAAGLALAGCGGSSHTATTAQAGAAQAQAQIKSAYEQFFSDRTDVPAKVRLLENGSSFEPLIFKFTNNPLAVRVKVTVPSVTLEGPSKAKVVYQVHFASVSLPTKTGTAVKQNGRWKVGDATLCQLIALQGSAPSACKS